MNAFVSAWFIKERDVPLMEIYENRHNLETCKQLVVDRGLNEQVATDMLRYIGDEYQW